MTHTEQRLQAAGHERFLTTAEVADWLHTPAETLRFWRHAGRGPQSFKFPGARRVLYAAEEVQTWIDAAREVPDGVG